MEKEYGKETKYNLFEKKGFQPFFIWTLYSAIAAAADRYSYPNSCATASKFIRPACTFKPFAKCSSCSSATRHPFPANALTNGYVALVNAKVEVLGTAPGILVTQ